jgi:hypothetical protein
MSSSYHPILTDQLKQCFSLDQLVGLSQDSKYGNAFTVFLSHVSRTYSSIDKQYSVARAIAKTARRNEERLSRFECIAHYANDILTITRPDGVAIYSSPAVKADLGFEPALFMSGDNFDRDMVHPDDIPLLQQGILIFASFLLHVQCLNIKHCAFQCAKPWWKRANRSSFTTASSSC